MCVLYVCLHAQYVYKRVGVLVCALCMHLCGFQCTYVYMYVMDVCVCYEFAHKRVCVCVCI